MKGTGVAYTIERVNRGKTSGLGHKQKFSDTPDHVRLAPYSGHHVRPVARLIQVLSTMILHVPSKAPTEL